MRRAGLIVVVACCLFACRKHVERRPEHTEIRDRGTACLSYVGGVFQGPGLVTVEATVTVPGGLMCSDYDFAACTISVAEHGEIRVESSVKTLPSNGACEAGRVPLVVRCHASVPESRDVVFGRGRGKEAFSHVSPTPFCIDG